MPELPEVETVVRDLREAGLVDCRIERVDVRWPRTVGHPTVAGFRKQLQGARITALGRRGKFIVAGLSNGLTLLVHLRMTGQFCFAGSARRSRHEHIELVFDDGRRLRFRDTRKFGRWYLTDAPHRILSGLGPEPLSRAFSLRRFREMLCGRGGRLKPLLLNQRFLAGLGNIYVDEALWEAKLHPQRKADTLSAGEQQRLHRAIRSVLKRGISASGTTLGTGRANFYSVSGRRGDNQNGLRVFRQTGRACRRCGTPIERLVVAQRGSHVCPVCQPFPAPEASRAKPLRGRLRSGPAASRRHRF